MWRRAGESNPQARMGHPLSRRAPGTDAGRTLRYSPRKERESNPQGSSPPVFKTVAIAALACPSIRGSGGNRTHVLRFKRPVQPSFCYRPVGPTGWRAGGNGVLADTPVCELPSCQRTRVFVPDPGVEPGARGSEPRVLPLDQSGSRAAERSAQRFRSSGDALAAIPRNEKATGVSLGGLTSLLLHEQVKRAVRHLRGTCRGWRMVVRRRRAVPARDS